ncbi:MAG: electron transport complex subunit RsxC, partial [Bacteroidales bacterium]
MLKTFPRGGVHPAENKMSAGKPIEILPLPDNVIIPVAQHLGVPSKPLVKRGDKVLTGQVIAQSEGFVSSNIHASVSGTVKKIDLVMDSSGYRKTAVFIQREGDEWIDGVDLSDKLLTDFDLPAEEITKKVLEAGIVGLGGATFPSHVKLSVPKGKKADTLIVNGVECEPYLTADEALMTGKAAEIAVGIKILMRALGVDRAMIGIENNKPGAIQKMKEAVAGEPSITVHPLKVKYPQGGEKQLVKALLNKEVPSGGLPIDIGVVAFNVGTIYAAYLAIQKKRPLVERVVTVTGKKIKSPANFMARIGTPISALIEAAGGLPENTGKIINGGPMMGKALNNLEAPVVKGSSGIVVVDESESHRKKVRNCIRCGKCVTVCPMALEPFLLQYMTSKGMFEQLEKERALDCMECGSCSYICPANRPLLDYIRYGKSTLRKI